MRFGVYGTPRSRRGWLERADDGSGDQRKLRARKSANGSCTIIQTPTVIHTTIRPPSPNLCVSFTSGNEKLTALSRSALEDSEKVRRFRNRESCTALHLNEETKMIRRTVLLTGLAVSLCTTTLSAAAFADNVTYPPGTDCANLATIAARLLCGRQELKRGDAAVQQQQSVPAPPYDGYSPDPDAAQPPPGGTLTAPTPPNPNDATAPAAHPQ
jgi:hypothetical protein